MVPEVLFNRTSGANEADAHQHRVQVLLGVVEDGAKDLEMVGAYDAVAPIT